MRTIHRGICLLAGLLPSVALAADAGPPTFRINGVELVMPIPPGYCLPADKFIDIAQLLAASDDRNVTHLTMLACPKGEIAEDFEDYVVIKTPKEALLMDMERQAFLDAISNEFKKSDFDALLLGQKGIKAAESSFKKLLGDKVELSGSLKPLGRDDVCAYLGGTVEFKAEPEAYSLSIAMCMTVVGRRIFTINLYGPDTSDAGVATLLVRVKALAGTIRPKLAS